jgi:hypothetical protein
VINITSTGDHRFGDASVWIKFHSPLRGYLTDAENFKAETYKENKHYSEK